MIVRLKRFDSKITAVLLMVMALFFSAFKLPQQQVLQPLTLSETPMKIVTDAFYIIGIKDERADKKNIAFLIPNTVNSIKKEAEAVPLKGGGLTAVESYIKRNLPYKAGLKPVIIRIKQMHVIETAMPDGRVDGKLELSMAFDLQTGDDLYAHLINYNGSAHYIRTLTQANIAEPVLRNAIGNAMVFFNNWMNRQADGNPLLAKEVKLVFSDYDEQPENDTIYYAAKRPLTWADFKDKPRYGKYAAEIMPGLGYAEQTSIKKGVIYVNLAMKVFVPKSASWVGPGNETAYGLNHEQRHFDIVKLVSERFKKRMLKVTLPVLNYDGYINVEYFEALREIEKMQKQYDDETAHGINSSAQERWNILIDKEITSFNN